MHPLLLNTPAPVHPERQALSSLMDSDLPADQWPGLVAGWQQDADQRATWHCYQLIGDVLRSDELASDPGRDAAMLLALRARLADEPVPLAPRALVPAAQPARRVWSGRLIAPLAVAVGFVVVAGLLVVTRSQAPGMDDGGQLALNGASAGGLGLGQVAQAQPAGLVRDAGLDRYLEAHRKLGNGGAVAGANDHRVQIVYPAK